MSDEASILNEVQGHSETSSAAPRTYRQMVWKNFKRKPLAVAGMWITIVLIVVALLAPVIANDRPILLIHDGKWDWPIFSGAEKFGDLTWKEMKKETPFVVQQDAGGPGNLAVWPLVPFSPTEYNLLEVLAAPDIKHWFGTDDSGRDVLSRMVHGAGASLSVGFVAEGIAVIIGIVLGALAGYFGRWVDVCVSRLIEILVTIPTFFLIIAVIAFLEPSIYKIMIVIGLTGWTGVARFVRAEFFKLKQLDFVMASKALGASNLRIIFLHMLPNAMAPVLVSAVFGIAGAILTESSLSFLGFGVQPPKPSWGNILSQSRDYIEFAWWLTVFPGLAIFSSITAYNVVGDGLRDAMDPKLFR